MKNFKSAMDQIKPEPEMLEQIIEKVEKKESKSSFESRKFIKYGVMAASIFLFFGGVAVAKLNSEAPKSTASNSSSVTSEDTSSETNYPAADVAVPQENGSSEVYMILGLEASYAIPTDYTSLKESAQYVFTFKPVEELDSVYSENGLIYTTYKVEVTNTIKGDISGTVQLMIPGGAVTVEEYYNSIDSYAASKQFPNGIESISDQLVVSDEEKSVPVTIGQEYLATVNFDEVTGKYVVLADVYGIYTICTEGAINEYSGELIYSSEF